MAKSRKVWIKIVGLPLHVWEESTFKKIGNLFGDFLDFDEATIGKWRFDLARIQVVTGRNGLIDECLRIKFVGM